MAWYIDSSRVLKSTGKPHYWSERYSPGNTVPVSGIYICTGCEREIAANKDDPFPPQNTKQHPAKHGQIEWELLACTKAD